MSSTDSQTSLQILNQAGMRLIGIEELSQIINRATATIRCQASAAPHKLPPRFNDGTSSVSWLLADVWQWLQDRRSVLSSEFKHVPVAPAPSTKEVSKKLRGRPSAGEIAEARKRGITVSQLRAEVAGGAK